jgi:hypothetical protein
MPVTNEHQPKLKLRTGKPFPPRTHLKKFQCKSNGKINFQPPLSDGSSDSPAVDANPCPSVTGIASNRQNYIQIASPFPRAIRKSFRMEIHGKMDFSTAARSPVVRFTRGRRQSMPVSNGHRLKPSKLHSNSFPFFQGHPKIIPPLNYMEKFDFSTAARSPVVRFTRGRRQSVHVSIDNLVCEISFFFVDLHVCAHG